MISIINAYHFKYGLHQEQPEDFYQLQWIVDFLNVLEILWIDTN